MERELKFRVWDKIKGLMFYQNIQPLGAFFDHTAYPINESKIIQQSTGLKDKNGKGIYEGDIIELQSEGQQRIPRCEVIFEQGCWCIKADWLDANKHSNPELKYYTIFKELESDTAFKDCLLTEIVGNIFQNPELLTQPQPA